MPTGSDDPDAVRAWARASHGARRDPSLISLERYGALFSQAFARAYPSRLDREARAPGPVPFSVEVRAPSEDPGIVIVSNGLGRVAQPGGDEVGAPHVELVAWVNEASPRLVALVARIAGLLHGRGPDAKPWKAGDTLRAPVPELGIAGFVLADGGFVPMPAGAPICLLGLVPLNDAEYAAARHGGSAWLDEHYSTADARRARLARFGGPVAEG